MPFDALVLNMLSFCKWDLVSLTHSVWMQSWLMVFHFKMTDFMKMFNWENCTTFNFVWNFEWILLQQINFQYLSSCSHVHSHFFSLFLISLSFVFILHFFLFSSKMKSLEWDLIFFHFNPRVSEEFCWNPLNRRKERNKIKKYILKMDAKMNQLIGLSFTFALIGIINSKYCCCWIGLCSTVYWLLIHDNMHKNHHLVKFMQISTCFIPLSYIIHFRSTIESI